MEMVVEKSAGPKHVARNGVGLHLGGQLGDAFAGGCGVVVQGHIGIFLFKRRH